MLVVVSKAKEYAKTKHDIRLGKDFLDKLSEGIEGLIDESVARAIADKRGTVKERDLIINTSDE